MDKSNLNQWVDLRYRYHLAGRTLLFNNQMQTAVLMLGYAIEAHMKQLISADKTIAKKHSFGHDFHGSYAILRSAGYLSDVDVSEDFLLFVEDNFDRRYPSQTDGTIKRANSRGHAISVSPTVIIPYDEFILQLDHSLTLAFQNPGASVLMHAAKSVDCSGGEYFFHNNYSAIARLDIALRLCEEDLLLLKNREPHLYDINLKAHQDRKLLLEDPEKLLNSKNIGMHIKPGGGVKGALKSAKTFVYPGKVINNPDGSVTHSSSY